jgi:hypothetical protein
MAGRHRWRGRHRKARLVVPVPRVPRHAVRIVDARTELEHLMTQESAALAAHRHAGRYLALCGAAVLAASMTTPERGQCRPCRLRLS